MKERGEDGGQKRVAEWDIISLEALSVAGMRGKGNQLAHDQHADSARP